MDDQVYDQTEIRVRQPFRLPLDPLQITTMSDYDISLLLFRSWFNNEDGRIARPDLIETSHFDEKRGAYVFTMSKRARWSTGEAVTPEDLRLNLKRAIEVRSSYGQSLSEIIDIASFETVSESAFKIRTKSGGPSDTFFQRMGSAFLAVVSPRDFDSSTFEVLSNKVSSGPYQIACSDTEEIRLVRNPEYLGHDPKAPATIRIRKPEADFDLMEFLKERTWENYVQLTSFVPPEALEKLVSSKLPCWTRGYDRVSILKPLGAGESLAKRREALMAIGVGFQSRTVAKSELNVAQTLSLQPVGYPLYEEIKFPRDGTAPRQTHVRILAPSNYSGDFHRSQIDLAAKSAGIKVEWHMVDPTSFTEALKNVAHYDLALVGLGVADPEPTTWMGLLFSQDRFISFDESDRDSFRKISGAKTKEEEVEAYRALLKAIALKGGYLPLFHFSTLSIGHRNLNFRQIRPLDETVNLSKVIME